MGDSLFVRMASKADLPDVLRLYAQPDFDNNNVLGLLDAERIYEQMLRYPNYKIYVAVNEGVVVGTFALLIMDNLGHMGALSAIIEDVAVSPISQGQGIVKFMMNYAMDLATECGCYKVVLSSNLKRERSHSFYESLDFERHGYSFLTKPKVNN